MRGTEVSLTKSLLEYVPPHAVLNSIFIRFHDDKFVVLRVTYTPVVISYQVRRALSKRFSSPTAGALAVNALGVAVTARGRTVESKVNPMMDEKCIARLMVSASFEYSVED